MADAIKKEFAGDSRSDHIALLRAYKVGISKDIITLVETFLSLQGWEDARYHGSARDYCWDNFLANNTLEVRSGF